MRKHDTRTSGPHGQIKTEQIKVKRWVHLRAIQPGDCPVICKAFADQGWHKPVAQYERYVQLHRQKTRDVIVAEWEHAFAGYVTIQWQSDYVHFRSQQIPEIVDLNVLIQYQRKGIATAMLDEAEQRIAERSPWAGIGVGLLPDYGAAHQLYVQRAYVPDGRGLAADGTLLVPGASLAYDHRLAMYLVKDLRAK
ncbi:MAG: GNAT family N-acetyltransferase [Saprospiraceae bacterium]|nr:GNAT family N-acetyltransferase [Saprospiraceae bacterium]